MEGTPSLQATLLSNVGLRTDKGTSNDGLCFLQNLENARDEARCALESAQRRQTKYANKERRELVFEEDYFVLLDNKNIRLKVDGPKKLLPSFLGPFQVLKRIGKVAYELEIPPTWEVHKYFM